MATARSTANTVAQLMVTVPPIKRAKLKSVQIDNQSGAGRTVRLQDIFLPDASVAAPAPLAQTVERFDAYVANNTTYDATQNALKGKEFLGTITQIADAVAANCVVIVGYDLE